ncbi:hypothetical protein [Fibrella forsythiae]|uniref:hypothetical protein n=1 Tax=Fibrella forsythiae TaxID=2817061 RepID=UPI001E4F8C46|nr:hypothetical protein [Fibrella forsythiae]
MNESTQEPNEEQWEADFQRWGKRPQPELRPFFYTRLQARLAKSVEQTDWLPWWLRKPVYAYSALLLLVLLNIGAAWLTTTRSQPTPDQMATTTTHSLVDDYDVDPVILAYE